MPSNPAITRPQALDVVREELKVAVTGVSLGSPAEFEGLILVGPGTVLDSLALISLISGVEARLKEQHGIALTLFSEQALDPGTSPLRTVAAMADYIVAEAAKK